MQGGAEVVWMLFVIWYEKELVERNWGEPLLWSVSLSGVELAEDYRVTFSSPPLSAPTNSPVSYSACALTYMHAEGVVWPCSCFPSRWCLASSNYSALINFNRFLVLWGTRKTSTSSGPSFIGLLAHSSHPEYCPNMWAVSSCVSLVCCPLYRVQFSLTIPHHNEQNQSHGTDVITEQ